MRIAMIGAGYVGLVSGACLADFGHEVTCIDSDAKKITGLNRGEIPIYEPGLDQLVKENVAVARLFFQPTSLLRLAVPMLCSLPLELHPAGMTSTPIFPTFTRLPAKSLPRSKASRWWPQSRQFRWEPVTKLNASSARSTLLPMWLWCPVRNFCARVRPCRRHP